MSRSSYPPIAGRLVPVLPERIGSEVHFAAVYPEREFVSPAARAFLDAVVAWAKSSAELSRKLPECPQHGAKTKRQRAVAR
jgi:DNA-binding transcriptional LysR family regulator